MTIAKKMLKAEIALGSGQFGGGGNAKTLVGYRMAAMIDVAGGDGQGRMALAIYGLPLDVMNQLSTVGKNYKLRMQNKVQLYAGETDDERTIKNEQLVFSGSILNAYVDANSAPNVSLRITANSAGGEFTVRPAETVSHKGSQDVAGLIKPIAEKMGLKFENNGVDVKLADPYYGGTLWTQAKQIAQHANIDLFVDRDTLSIVPKDKKRSGSLLISPATGMVGYPTFEEARVVVKSIFSSDAKIGGDFEVKSDLTPANGHWKAYHINIELACLTPRGPWFMTISGNDTDGDGGSA